MRPTLFALVAAWLVPLLLDAAGLDAFVLPLLVVGVASVLRAGEGLLDRLVLAGVVTTGGLLFGGLLFSMWPWGLSPVPVGGVLLSALVVCAFAAGRRPSLALQLNWSDSVVVSAGVVAFVAVYRPVSGLSAVERLRFTQITLDRMAHFALFDTIHRLGGYAFLHQAQARTSVQTPTEVVYPQGSHYLLAVVDIFARSTTSPGPPLGELNRYFFYVLVGYALLVSAIVWAARWIAGPSVGEFVRVTICVVVTVFALAGPLAELIRYCFDSQVLGLLFVVLAAAVAVRPVADAREQVVLAAAVTLGVFYCYNIYGAITGLALLVSMVVYRVLIRAQRAFAAAVLLPAAAAAVLPSVMSVFSGFDVQRQALVINGRIALASELVYALGVLAVLPVLSRVARADGTWRGQTTQLAVTAFVIAGFGIYQVASIGTTSYYFDKFMVAGYVVALGCLGDLALLLAPSGARRGTRRPATFAVGRAGAAALAVVLLAAGVLQQTLVRKPGQSAWDPTVPIVQWSDGRIRSSIAPTLISLEQAGVLGDGVPTLIFYRPQPSYNWALSFFVASFNRDLGAMKPALNTVHNTVGNSQQPEAIVRAISQAPFPLRIVVGDKTLAVRLTALLRARSDLHATVRYVPAIHI